MYTEKLLSYLSKNINEEDRKVYNKLLTHIKKRHVKSLSSLVSAYNIDKKKIIFAAGEELTDDYINKLELLISYCRKIIDNKINISAYEPTVFMTDDLLDLSTSFRIEDLLQYLYTFDKYYDKISLSKDLDKNPLLILTSTTKKRLDLGLIEQHAYNFCNNHAIVKDQIQEVHSDLSAVSNFKKNYILEKKQDAIVEPEIVKLAIKDYFESNDELFYLCADAEEQISKSINELIESKSHQEGVQSSSKFKLFEYTFPLINLIALILIYVFSIFTGMNLTFLAILFAGYAIFTFGLYIIRVNVINDNSNSFSYKYYVKYPARLTQFKIFSIAALVLSFVYLFIFSNIHLVISNANLYLVRLYNNQVAITLLTGLLISLGFIILLVTSKLFKKQFSIVGFILSLFYIFIVFCIRTNLFNFIAYEGASIFFVVFAIALLLFLVLEHDNKILNGIFLGIVLLDLIIMLVSNNEFYLRFITQNIGLFY